MASQHHFSDRLRTQLNESNARNLELQALLAQRDDALASCNARLQNALSATSVAGASSSILQSELSLANEAAASAETRLSQAFAVFDQERNQWKKDIEKLQREVTLRDSVLSDANFCLAAEVKRSSTVDGMHAELARTHAELKKTRQYAARIQKQFEAEKKENALRYPATAAGKERYDLDQDDEEVIDDITRIKHETESGTRRRRSSIRMTSQRRLQERRSAPFESDIPVSPVLPYRPLLAQVMKRRQAEAPSPWKPRSRTRQPKRKRSSLEDEDLDYDDLEIDMDDSGGHSAQKRSKAIRVMEIEHLKETCNFKAITAYDDDGNKLYLDSKEDLADVCPDLWERIQKQHEAWERACGEDWRYDLESKYTSSVLAKPGAKPPCVTTKLLKISNGKANWRAGHEGRYACLDCAREKRPCFTWDGEELYLLPLHEKDKTYPEEDGFEIRTWLDVE